MGINEWLGKGKAAINSHLSRIKEERAAERAAYDEVYRPEKIKQIKLKAKRDARAKVNQGGMLSGMAKQLEGMGKNYERVNENYSSRKTKKSDNLWGL